jgi:hypothetical protein
MLNVPCAVKAILVPHHDSRVNGRCCTDAKAEATNGVNALLRTFEKHHDDDPNNNRPADRRKKYDEYD